MSLVAVVISEWTAVAAYGMEITIIEPLLLPVKKEAATGVVHI